MKIILLIYNDYFADRVDIIATNIAEKEEEDVRVYHIPEENAADFFKEKNNIDKVYFTNSITLENKKFFSKKPYSGTQIG